MAETTWEAVKKSRKKTTKIFLSILLPIFFIVSIVIINNTDIFSDKKNDDIKELTPSDSALFSLDTEGSPFSEHNENLEKDLEILVNTGDLNGAIRKGKNEKNNDCKLNESKEHEKKEIKTIPEKKLVTSDSLEHAKDGKRHNNISSQQYSILLSGVKSKVNDRKDVIISLALELFYKDTSETREILIKRDALKVIAQKVIQNKEFSVIKKELLSEELKNEMNLIFDRKALEKVIIREFQIEKANAQ